MSLFRKNSIVIELAPENFDAKSKTVKHYLLDGKTRGMVMFGAKWCGYCKISAPEYEKAATVFGSAFPLYYLDCEKYGEFAGKSLGISGYPTIMYLSKSGKMYKKYSGERTYQAFTQGVCSETSICKK